jgi:hypothetical protein
MGGYGSGKKNTDQLRPVVENSPCLNILDFKKEGLLDPGMAFIMDFTVNGADILSLSVSVAEDALVIEYYFNQTRRKQELALARTTCHYGGSRAWLLCPKCQAKRNSLYLGPEGFWACRECLGLAYTVQRLNPHERHQYRAETIKKKKLKIIPGSRTMASEKPFGMWRSRYIRMLDELLKHETLSHSLFMTWCTGIIKKEDGKDKSAA